MSDPTAAPLGQEENRDEQPVGGWVPLPISSGQVKERLGGRLSPPPHLSILGMAWAGNMAIPFAHVWLSFLFFPSLSLFFLISSFSFFPYAYPPTAISTHYSKLSVFNPVHNNFSGRVELCPG
ncbi:hypothetical protein LY76DRAFT_302390 [Colletotrichum caudatum]|nr:hypothetical protein LY76DRAFT_302390 [Colletotrichum caudatum]